MTSNTSQYVAVRYLVPFPLEVDFDFRTTVQWTKENRIWGFYLIIIYLSLVAFGQWYMKDKPRQELRPYLITWNFFLGIFSIFGATRTVPEIWYTFKQHGFHGTVCVANTSPEFNIPQFWVFLFSISKIPELVDTMFLVLRKQRIILLHWYHHGIIVLYSFYMYAENPAALRWFVSMNYCIHAMMYNYYGLRALGFRIPKGISMTITSLQILQMAVGSVVCSYNYLAWSRGWDCEGSRLASFMCVSLYVSFFVLFCNFFIQTYYFEKPKKKIQ